MRFRDYTAADIEAMHSLDAICFTEPFQFDRLLMRQFAEEPGAIVILVDDVPGEVIAFIILHLEGAVTRSQAYVVTIDVSPEHRRHGIGAAMLDRAEAAARSAGARSISLHVAVDNPAAISFYERQNYARTGLAEGFYREAGQDAIVFAKRL